MKTTIIIPVKNDENSLIRTLESIERQNTQLIDKVVVIENGSDRIKFLPRYTYALETHKLLEANRSKARNFGASLAQSTILVFLDADIVLQPNWIESVLGAFTPDTLSAQTEIIPAADKNSLLQRVRFSRAFMKNHRTFFSLNKKDPENIILNSAAFAVRKIAFDQLQGFDENLPRYEDLDFTQRLLSLDGRLKGIRTSFCEVYFVGGLIKYFLREFDCGYHIVRYHEKWKSRDPLAAFKSLGLHSAEWIKRPFQKKVRGEIGSAVYVLELFFLLGSFFGLMKLLIAPYPHEPERRILRAKVEIR